MSSSATILAKICEEEKMNTKELMTALFNFSHALMNGCEHCNITKNENLACLLLQKASDLGHLESTYNLALYYEDKEKNMEKAVNYYKKGIELGDYKSAFCLGLCYEQGKAGFDINLHKAEEMFRISYRFNRHYGPVLIRLNKLI